MAVSFDLPLALSRLGIVICYVVCRVGRFLSGLRRGQRGFVQRLDVELIILEKFHHHVLNLWTRLDLFLNLLYSYKKL